MRKLAPGFQNPIHFVAASLKWNCHFYPFLWHLGHQRFSLRPTRWPAFQVDQTSKEADEEDPGFGGSHWWFCIAVSECLIFKFHDFKLLLCLGPFPPITMAPSPHQVKKKRHKKLQAPSSPTLKKRWKKRCCCCVCWTSSTNWKCLNLCSWIRRSLVREVLVKMYITQHNIPHITYHITWYHKHRVHKLLPYHLYLFTGCLWGADENVFFL